MTTARPRPGAPRPAPRAPVPPRWARCLPGLAQVGGSCSLRGRGRSVGREAGGRAGAGVGTHSGFDTFPFRANCGESAFFKSALVVSLLWKKVMAVKPVGFFFFFYFCVKPE